MKHFILFLSALLLLCCDNDPNNNSSLILEAYLFANRQVDSIKISETMQDGSPFKLKPVIDADAQIVVNSKKYKLSNLKNHPGIYTADLIIEAGNQYHLNATIGNRKITAWTTIPDKSSDPKLTRDTIYKLENTTYLNIHTTCTNLSWNPGTEYSYLIKNKNTLQGTPSSSVNGFSYVPYYFLGPISDNLISMNSDEFDSPGSYYIIVLQINNDFKKIFTDIQKQTFLNAAQDNISGAYGIFTGVYSDTIKLEVVSKK